MIDKHFLPDAHDFGELTLALEKLIEVPTRRVQYNPYWVDKPPFLILGCTWHRRDCQGVLTADDFRRDLAGALQDLAAEINCYEEFLAYPVTYKPPVVEGVAYHDWVGAVHPFDLRAIISLDHNIPAGKDDNGIELVETGLTFNILTLISSKSKRDVRKCD